MLYGHEDKVKIFKHLSGKEGLFSGYLFFGEPSVGKTTFALALANFLEKGVFEKPSLILSESKLVSPQEGSIGIDEVRAVKVFFSQKPTLSNKRVVIIEQADKLTPQAQNAVLKIAEEPPEKGLIILTATNPENILATLRSRLQLIHFGNVSNQEITSLLKKEYDLLDKKAQEIAVLSMGKPGRAVSMMQDDKFKEGSTLAGAFLGGSIDRRAVAERLTQEPDLLDIFVSHVLAELDREPLANYKFMSKLLDRVEKIELFSTNRRLQLESALWQN